MAVAFDATSNTTAASGGSLSWTHTPVGTPAAVVVKLSAATDGATWSSVTYGGVSMSAVSGTYFTTADGGVGQLWCLFSSIPTGAQTVAATCSSSTGGLIGSCETLTAAATVEVVSSVVSTVVIGTSDSKSLVLDSRNAWVGIAIGSGHSTESAGVSTPTSTQVASLDYGTNHGRHFRVASLQTGTITVTVTNGISDDLIFSAAGFAEVAGGATSRAFARAFPRPILMF